MNVEGTVGGEVPNIREPPKIGTILQFILGVATDFDSAEIPSASGTKCVKGMCEQSSHKPTQTLPTMTFSHHIRPSSF